MSGRKIIEASGLGNSFIILDLADEDINNIDEQRWARIRNLLEISKRDSALIVGQTQANVRDNVVQMRILESDGSESNMCGNGLRVMGQYFFETGQGSSLQVQTKAGLVSAERINSTTIKSFLGSFTYRQKVLAKGEIIHDTDVGEPHAITFATHEQVEKVFKKLASAIAVRGQLLGENGKSIQGTHNLNVVTLDKENPKHIFNRTFERGVNRETLACGTGAACAASSYGRLFLPEQDFKVNVTTLSGDLSVEKKGLGVYVTGPAKVEKTIEM